jgi:hypothetical protein
VANPTTNYSFVLPTSSDLVTDLPADFDVALQGVDTRLKALNPSTTLGDTDYASATANTNTRLPIGSTGQVLTVTGGVPTWATPSGSSFVGVSASFTANQSLADATATAVSFTTEQYDTDGFHDNSTNNSRFTIPAGKAGKYVLTGQLGFGPNATGTRGVHIYKNGSAIIYNNITNNGGTYGTFAGIHHTISLAVTDYIEFYAFQTSGGALVVSNPYEVTNVQLSYLGA